MKPKTHVFLANIALKDALQDKKVTIYATDYANGTVGSPIGDFEVDPQVLQALSANAAQFRAGVLGPDAYPDIATGQEIIHPAGKDTPGQPSGVDINTQGSGSDPWLEYLYSRAFKGCDPNGSASNPDNMTTANQAFVLGYLAHAATDMYAHTLINYFAGGPFHFTPTPENAIKHMIVEGYIEKRTPKLDSDSYNASIANGVDQFIYRNMIDADRNLYLKQKLLIGSNTSYSLPAIFSILRGKLVKDIKEYYDTKADYDRQYDETSSYNLPKLFAIETEKLAYMALNAAQISYKEAWRDDIDEGLNALPQMSDRLAKALFFNTNGMNKAQAQAIADDYTLNHLASMGGTPDFVGQSVYWVKQIIAQVLDALGITWLKEAIDQAERDLFNYLLKNALGFTIDEIKEYVENPGTLFEQGALNKGTGQHITLSVFNAQELHISDPGNANPSEFFDYTKFPAAYNAVVMIKLALMSRLEVNRLMEVLAKKFDPGSTPPVLTKLNAMLGFIETLDGSNQWNANSNKMIVAQNPKLYQSIFMWQSGTPRPIMPQPSTPQWSNLRKIPPIEVSGNDFVDFDDIPATLGAINPITLIIVRSGRYVHQLTVNYGDTVKSHGDQSGTDAVAESRIILKPGDYITEVSGSVAFGDSLGHLYKLSFKTKNGMTYGPFGDANYLASKSFSFKADKNEQVVGFCGSTAGRGGGWLSAIGVGLATYQ